MARARARFGRWAVVAILVLAYGWWAVSLQPFSASATVAVVVPGATAVVLGTIRRRPHRQGRPVRPLGFWATVGAAAVCWQLAAYLQAPRADHPTLSSLADALLGTQAMRTAAFALWLAAAVELARR